MAKDRTKTIGLLLTYIDAGEEDVVLSALHLRETRQAEVLAILVGVVVTEPYVARDSAELGPGWHCEQAHSTSWKQPLKHFQLD